MVDLPAAPDGLSWATGTLPLRYEDVTQDGRIVLELGTHGLGETIWRQLIRQHPLAEHMRQSGLVPILSRLRLVGEDGPFSVASRMTARGTFALAHGVDASGAVDRILLQMWTTLSAPHAHTYGPPPPADAPAMPAVHVFAEHTMTRLFAPPAERRVRALPGAEPVPPRRAETPPPASLLALPPGATPLDDALRPDSAVIVFGLMHTDSNQHVNSLVYPRLFEEALLRRLAEHGRSPCVVARTLDIAYRKPCFAGEALRVWLRAFGLPDGSVGAVGVFIVDGDTPGDKPHTWVRLCAR